MFMALAEVLFILVYFCFLPEPNGIKRTKYEDKRDTVSVTEEIDKKNTTIFDASNK